MSSNTILSTEFNGRNVTVSQPKAVEIEKEGKKQVVGKKAFLNYNGERLVLQSGTEMRVPFGLSVYKAEGGGQDKYSINLSFTGYKESGDVKAFYDAVTALDTEVVNQAVKNSKAWFGKEKSREVLEEFYTPSVKFGKDASKDYPPTMKLNLRRNGDSFETKFYDVHGKKFTGLPAEEMLAKGTLVTALIECSDVWIAGTGKFNLRWNVTQIIIHKLPERGAEFAFKLPGGTPAPQADSYDEYVTGGAGGGNSSSNNVVDDEEEAAATSSSVVAAVLPAADEDEDDEEAPPPPKKLTVAKKKPVVAAKRV
jgi:hypothetical protein